MIYRATIHKKTYDLPARTLSVDDKIDYMARLDELYSSGEMTRRDVVQAQHDFVSFFAPDALPPVDDVDVNELLVACIAIISAYNAPAIKAKVDAQTAQIKGVLSNGDVQQLMKLNSVRGIQ